MKLSIAMASYNGGRFIREQLDSFAWQTVQPDEVVVSDDGSTDETIEIIEQFATTVPFPVKVYRNSERLGYSRNFEQAIQHCTGDIIFLSDQDDVWFPEKLQIVRDAFLASEHTLVVVNDQVLTDRQLRHSNVTKLQNLRGVGQNSNGLVEGCCTAFRRKWGKLLLPLPQTAELLLRRRALSHDLWLNELAIFLRVRTVMERPLQFFRRYGGNTTSWVVSEPRQLKSADLIRMRQKIAPVGAWIQRIEILDFYRDWLVRNDTRLIELGIPGLSVALGAMARERESLQTRATLVRLPLLQRLVKIVQLWNRGGYDFFYGWKSAIRDVLRTAA